MPWSDSVPQFSSAAMVIGFALVAYAAVAEPLLGRWFYQRLQRRRETDPRALTRFYGAAIGIQWVWAAAVVAALVLSPGLAAADLGLRLPHAWAPILGGLVGAAAMLLVFRFLNRTPRKGTDADAPPQPDPGSAVAAELAPHTWAERRMAAALAVTAGVCEELLYRGLFVALGASLGLPVWLAAVLSCVLFALAHVYQGWWGLVGPGVLGATFMILYLATGSLFVAVIAHALIDLRVLFGSGGGRRGAGTGAPAAGGPRGGHGGRRAKGRRHRTPAA